MVLTAETPVVSAEIVKAAIAEGLLLVPAGPKVVRFVPPLIVSAAEVEQALAALKRALTAIGVAA